jgi:hypothetical protein
MVHQYWSGFALSAFSGSTSGASKTPQSMSRFRTTPASAFQYVTTVMSDS